MESLALGAESQRRGSIQKTFEIGLLIDRVAEAQPKVVVEIGSFLGGTFYCWCQAADPQAFLVSMDYAEGKFRPEDLAPVSLLRSFGQPMQDLRFVRGDSHKLVTRMELMGHLAGREVDFLFIDGDHTYEGVKQDWEMYSPLVRDGGLVAFHDIVDHPPELDCHVAEVWREIKDGYMCEEFIDDDGRQFAGIGLLTIPGSSRRPGRGGDLPAVVRP